MDALILTLGEELLYVTYTILKHALSENIKLSYSV